ncbi:MAG: response regulator [Ginsengibacter sp.]|jgi:two-component system alkaline phosphatase synthesis response regulator PhoP
MSRILLIDDDKDLLTILKTTLIRKGFEVYAQDSWEGNSEVINLFKPNLVILDVFLSGIDGLDICKKIKKSPFTKNLPVLIISGFPWISQSAIYEFGANDFIAKPFEINDLLKKIHKIFNRKHESV